MHVIFRRTGERRYAVVVQKEGAPPQSMDPAPGFDEHIPHDLVHYVVEAELGLHSGVFGRAARGAGTFIASGSTADARQRARARRKQLRREQSLSRQQESEAEMQSSERLAYHADITWRRLHGQRPGAAYAHVVQPTLSSDDAGRVARVVARLDELAPRWRALPVDGELTFVWPSTTPR